MRDLTSVSINFTANGAWIGCSKDEDEHKGTLSVNEKRLQEECEKYGKEFKYMKGFEKFYIGFGQIDYYDSCDTYYVPSALYRGKKVQIDSYNYNIVPKDWERGYTLYLSEVKTMRPFNKFIEVLGITLTKKQLNKIRKAIKEQSFYKIDLSDNFE